MDCGVDSALIGFLIAVSVPFGWILIGEQIPQKMVGWLLNIFSSQAGVLLFITVLLLLAGTVLEPAPAMLIFVPLLLPVVKQFGIDPIHFGVVLIVNLLIGSLSPPVGILVFITAVIAKVPAAAVFRELNPFLAALILGLFILTYVPVLTTWLPSRPLLKAEPQCRTRSRFRTRSPSFRLVPRAAVGQSRRHSRRQGHA